MDPIYEKLTEILERTVRVETKVDNLTEDQKSIEVIQIDAQEAKASASSAHRRLDKIDKIVYWLATTIIGTVILAILAVIFVEV